MIEVVRLLLAAMFAVAAVAKLADLRAAAVAAQGFGAPRRAALPAALFVVLAELAIAVALVPAATARAGAAAGAALLIMFSGAVALARLRGLSPDCHCFGRLRSAPAGWGTLVRNAALAMVALLLALQPAFDPTLLELAAVAVAAVVFAQALLLLKLLRRYGEALRRIEELQAADSRPTTLEVGAEAPSFALPGLDGRDVTLAGLLERTRPILLVFADPDCGPCHALMPRVADWQRSFADRLTVAVVTRGDREDNLAVAREHGLSNVLVQADREINELYGTWATPSAVLVGAGGRIEHAVAAGAQAIEGVVEALTPAEQPPEPEPARAHRELAAAAVVAGGLAAPAAVAQASPGARKQQPTNPELQAIDAALKAAGPRLVAASRRSMKAIRVQATLRDGKAARAKRKAAQQALAAERREVLALRAAVAKLAGTSIEAHNVKVMVNNSLSLLAQSLTKRQQAIGASPTVGLRLLDEGEQLFLRSVGGSAAAGKVLGRRR